MDFESALQTAIARNPMNSYERALAMLEMIDLYPERLETIMRFLPDWLAPSPSARFSAVT